MSLEILEKKLPERIKKVWWIENIIAMVVLLIIAGGLGWFLASKQIALWWVLIPIVLFVATLIYAIIMIPLDWARWSYQIKPNEIEIQHGVIFRKQILIPMIRIQHVEMEQGPLLRPQKLMSISIATAAQTHEIEAVDENEAVQLRDQILTLVKAAKEDV